MLLVSQQREQEEISYYPLLQSDSNQVLRQQMFVYLLERAFERALFGLMALEGLFLDFSSVSRLASVLGVTFFLLIFSCFPILYPMFSAKSCHSYFANFLRLIASN